MLDGRDCGLEALPHEIGTACRELEELHADGNGKLAALPASLCTLPKLRVLNLRCCAALTALPPEIVRLTQLDGALGEDHGLDLTQCEALVTPPYSVVEDSNDHFAAVRDWFAQQRG